LHVEDLVLGKFLERKGLARAVILPKGRRTLLARKNPSPPRNGHYGLLATNLR
jgi:hypothetical protein